MIKETNFCISGMSCSACSARVERSVAPLRGIQSVQVNLLTGNMKVSYDNSSCSESDIISAVTAAGYGAEVAHTTTPTAKGQDTELRHRFLLSVSMLLPVVMLHHLWHNELSALAQLILTLPILWINRAFFVKGWNSARHGGASMDTLVTLGATAAMVDGIANFFLHHRAVFHFESAAMILTIITLGKWLESRATGRTSAALQKLLTLLPQTATVLRGGKIQTVPADAVSTGETVIIRPGDRVAIDGVVIEGVSAVDESALTGESLPVTKSAGATVYAGSVNSHGTLQLRASAPRSESAMAGIIQLVSEASASKAPISRLADRISGIFVPTVVAIACIAAIVWLVLGYSAAFALSCSIAILVISCPCALGLATPVAIMVGTGRGAENNILFRSGEALENAHQVDCIILDKTGTLTEGKPRVTDILPTTGHTPEELLHLAITLEATGNHPLARAIQEAGKSISPGIAKELEYHPGRGITAQINNLPCAAGNMALMHDCGLTPNTDRANKLAAEGKTPLYFARGGECIGLLAVADPLKEGSSEAVADFYAMGLRVIMMTGDHEQTARAIAQQAGIKEWYAEVLPQDKDAMVQRWQQEGHRVAVIGDGINDAPALTRANVGIAIGAGTDIAMESADIILARSDLRDAVDALRLSRATMLNIRENLFWALLYNSLAIPLAAGVFYPFTGWLLHPAIGAAAMGASSVCVVINALRLRRFSFKQKKTTMNTITISISGMMCPHCENHVTQALLAIPGVATCHADHKTSKATLTLSAPVPLERLEQAVRDAGYTVTK